MKRLIKTLGWTVLATLLLGAAALVGTLVMLADIGPFNDTVIRLDDTTLSVVSFRWTDWLTVVLGIGVGLVVALIALVVIVPVAVLLPLLLVALVLGGVVLAVAGVAALAFSPLILLAGAVWVVWRLLHARQGPPRGDAAEIGMLR